MDKFHEATNQKDFSIRKILSMISRRRFLRISMGGMGGGLIGYGVAKGARSRNLFEDQEWEEKPGRLRDLGIKMGRFPPGPYNGITDVKGVKVGHCTKIEGSGKLQVGIGPVRTGVTVILPHSGNIFEEKLAVGHFVLNGNGEMTGFVRNRDAGTLETPIYLTGTANIGIVYDAALTHLLNENPDIGVTDRVPVPVVAECWDGMGDTEGRHITEQNVLEAIENASSDPVVEGSVGGGTGMRSYGFKAGIGTSSRVLPIERGGYTVGVLVNANHGVRHLLRVDGVPVGKELLNYPEEKEKNEDKNKSIIMVAATDAPLLPVQLHRLCKRMSLGLARTGSVSTHGSGDIFIAFSTGNRLTRASTKFKCVDNGRISNLWEATVEAAEEAVLNALTASRTMDGADGVVRYGFPLNRVVTLMKKYKRL